MQFVFCPIIDPRGNFQRPVSGFMVSALLVYDCCCKISKSGWRRQKIGSSNVNRSMEKAWSPNFSDDSHLTIVNLEFELSDKSAFRSCWVLLSWGSNRQRNRISNSCLHVISHLKMWREKNLVRRMGFVVSGLQKAVLCCGIYETAPGPDPFTIEEHYATKVSTIVSDWCYSLYISHLRCSESSQLRWQDGSSCQTPVNWPHAAHAAQLRPFRK